jgi:hypothetical protein
MPPYMFQLYALVTGYSKNEAAISGAGIQTLPLLTKTVLRRDSSV